MYVVGNQKVLEVERRVIGGKPVVLVALPTFSTTGIATMINLCSLDVEPICFDTERVEQSKEDMEVEEEEEDVVIDEDIANEDAE